VRCKFFPTEKKLIDLVLPGLELVRARFRELISLFIREDFPTFDLPAKAISGLSEGGSCSGRAALAYLKEGVVQEGRRFLKRRLPSIYFLQTALSLGVLR